MTSHRYDAGMDIGDVVTATEAAALAGIEQATFTSYVNRGQAPAEVGRVGARRVWSRTEVEEWIENRPGQGRRTDLQRTRA